MNNSISLDKKYEGSHVSPQAYPQSSKVHVGCGIELPINVTETGEIYLNGQLVDPIAQASFLIAFDLGHLIPIVQ